MKFLPMLLAHLGRKKIRTALTIGSFIVAFLRFGLLGAIRYGFRQGIDIAGADRLVVIGRTSIMQPLPITYLERLRRIDGVVFGFLDYNEELKYFDSAVMPLLRQAGLRK